MAGIGDSWGTREELLHPRDSKGRFRSKWKMSESVLNAVLAITQNFKPRTFASDAQATQYTQNLAHTKPGRFQGGRGYARLQADFENANNDLLDGTPDEPSTKKFVDMMDKSMIEAPDSFIASSVVGADAFGLTPETLGSLEDMTGNVIANRGYTAVNLGSPLGGGQGMITMSIATPKGTKITVPGRNPQDRAIYMDRDQEFTVTKVKPDGRGGYYMWAVATPKTPGENPAAEGGHAGGGHAGDREGDIKALEGVAAKRDMGEQGASQLPGGQAAGGLPEDPQGRVIRNAPATDPATERARSRAAILGRPAAPADESQAPTPAPAATPAPTPEAPNVPEAAPVPDGATSTATGEEQASFRDALEAANLESPSKENRKDFNDAIAAVESGKRRPADVVRDLDSDVAELKRKGSQEGVDREANARDQEQLEKLADLTREHFKVGDAKYGDKPIDKIAGKMMKSLSPPAHQEPSTPGPRTKSDLDKMVEKRLRPRPLDTPGPKTPEPPRDKTEFQQRAEAMEKSLNPSVPKVQKKKIGEPVKRVAGGDMENDSKRERISQVEQDAIDDRLNAEQRAQWSEELGPEPKELKGTAGNIVLDEMADLLRNGRITKAKAAERLRDQARNDEGPQWDYLRRAADLIENDESKANKRVPLNPKRGVVPGEAEASLAGRTEKNILTGLNQLDVGNLRGLADKWGVETRGDDKKLKLKAALSKELAAHWKSHPELQRKAVSDTGEPVPDVDELDAMNLVQLKAHAKERDIKLASGLRKAQIVAILKGRRDGQTEVASEPEVPAVAKKVAKKAAAAAAPSVADRAAPGTAAGKITAARVQVGDIILATQRADGTWHASPTKVKGAVPMTVTEVLPGSRGRRELTGVDANGEQISVNAAPSQTFHVGGATPKKVAKATPLEQLAEAPDVPEPIKKAAKKAAARKKLPAGGMTPEEFAEASPRILAGENVDAVGRDILGRRGAADEIDIPVEVPGKVASADEVKARLQDIGDNGDRQQGVDYLDGLKLSAKDMRQLASDLGVSTTSKQNKTQVRDTILNVHVNGRLNTRAVRRGLEGERFGAPETPAVPEGVPDIRPSGDSILARLQEFDNPLSREASAELLAPLKRPELMAMARELKIPRAGTLKMADLRQEIVNATSGRRIDSIATRGTTADFTESLNNAGQEVPAAARAAGIDAPELERLRERAREVLAEIQQAGKNDTDPFDDLLDNQEELNKRGIGVDIGNMAREVRDDIKANQQGPSTVSMEDRVAVAMLNKVRPEFRQEVLDAMPEKERNNLLDAARAVANEQKAASTGGPRLARLMSDAGIKTPRKGTAERGDYDTVDKLLAEGKIDQAKKHLDGVRESSDRNLKDYRARIDQPNQSESTRQFLSKEITKELDRSLWAGSARATLESNSPELMPKKAAAKAVQQARQALSPEDKASFDALTPDSVRETARRAGINVPEGAKDIPAMYKAILAEMARRKLAGEPVTVETPDVPERVTPEPTLPKVSTNIKGDTVEGHPYRDAVRRLEAGEITPQQAGQEMFETARHYMAEAKVSKRNGTLSPEAQDAASARNVAISNQYDKAATELRARKRVPKPAVVAEVLQEAADKVAGPDARIAALDRAGSADEGHAALKGLKKAELQELALRMGIAHPRNATNKQLADTIVFQRVTRRQTSDTLSRPAPSREDEPSVGEVIRRASQTAPAASPAAAPAPAPAALTEAKDAVREAQARYDTAERRGGENEDRADELDALRDELNQAEADLDTLQDQTPAPAPVKKAAKKAAPSVQAKVDVRGDIKSGKYTKDQLVAMGPAKLKDIEDDLGIVRPSLDRSERADAILAKQAADSGTPAPAKAAKKAAAAAQPKGAAVRGAPHNFVDAGNGRLKKVERANADEPLHLPNDGQDQGLIHMDSEIGKLWQDLVADPREPNSFVNEIARMGDEMGMQRLNLSQVIDRLREMKGEAVDSGVADRIQTTIDAVDAPPAGDLNLPSDLPVPLRNAFQQLAGIPTARKRDARVGNARIGDESVLDKKLALIRALETGGPEVTGSSGADIERRLFERDLHESADAATTMWKLFEGLRRDKAVQAWIRNKVRAARQAESPKADGGGRDSAAARRDKLRETLKLPGAQTQTLKAGAVTVDTHANGESVVSKKLDTYIGGLAAKRKQDGEVLTPLVHEAAGLYAPAVIDTPGEDHHITMEHISGQTGRELYPPGKNWTEKIPDSVRLSKDGYLLGMSDFITAHGDRHRGNWKRNDEGRIVALDNEDNFMNDNSLPDVSGGDGWIREIAEGDFASSFYQQGDAGHGYQFAKSNDMSPADMTVILRRLRALEPEFKKRKQERWFESMMERAQWIADHANGTESRL